MSVLTSASGFAAFGVLVRAYALALQKRPIMSDAVGYAAVTGAFGAFGYWMSGIIDNQNAMIEQKKEQLLQNRARAKELAAAAAAAAASSE